MSGVTLLVIVVAAFVLVYALSWHPRLRNWEPGRADVPPDDVA